MDKKRRRWSFRLLALLLLAGLMPTMLALAVPVRQAYAQSQEYHMNRYDSDITVNNDGSLDVVETLEYAFTSGSFHRGLREIDLSKVDDITNVRVIETTNGTSKAYKETGFDADDSTSGVTGTFGTEEADGNLRIRWIFGATSNATRTFLVSYHAEGAIRVYDNRDEFDWYAVPPEWSVPAYESKATATFPDVSSTASFTTTQSPFDAEVRKFSNTISWTASGTIDSDTGFEVGAQIPVGILSPVKPAWQDAVDQQEIADAAAAARQADYDKHVRPLVELAVLLLGLIITIGGILWSIMRWYTGGRDKPVALAADYLAAPPSDLPPGLVGTLLDESADVRDVIATIVDQGKKGNLTIAETQGSGLFAGKDFQYTQTASNTQFPYEAMTLNALFKSGSPTQLSDLKNSFYSSLPPIYNDMYMQLVGLKYFPESPATVRARNSGAGVGIIVLGAIVGFFWFLFGASFSQFLIVPAIGLGIVGLIRIGMASAMPKKTDFGAEEAEKWRAFRRYLENIQKYTGVEEAGKRFQLYLPYAVAMGVDHQYISQFNNVSATAMPSWYIPLGWNPYFYGGGGNTGQSISGAPGQTPSVGGGNFDPAGAVQGMSNSIGGAIQGLSDSFTSMVNSASSVLTSTPSSSGSSSGGSWGGGGGSFGGGGGGGGGGGAD